jgi:YD repeat-containing protein
VVGIDRYPYGASVDLSLGYGARGELTSVESSSGVYSSKYDAELRRVRRDSPPVGSGSGITTRSEVWRYGVDRHVLAYEDRRADSNGATVDKTVTEYVWLGTEPLAGR